MNFFSLSFFHHIKFHTSGLEFGHTLCSNERFWTGRNVKQRNQGNYLTHIFHFLYFKQYECQVTKHPPISIFLKLTVVGELPNMLKLHVIWDIRTNYIFKVRLELGMGWKCRWNNMPLFWVITILQCSFIFLFIKINLSS